MKKLIMIPVLLVLLLLTLEQGNAFDCEQAKSSVFPCGMYLLGVAPVPAPSCCSAVQNIKSSTPTVDDRRAACECLKEEASRYPMLREDLANSLPKACNVDIKFTISRNMDCSKID